MKRARVLLGKVVIGVLVLFGVTACVSIPQESADLSIELGKQIAAIKTSHMTLVDSYFAEKRDRVDEFIANKWLPEFAAQFYANEQVGKIWNQVVQANDPAENLKFIVTFGPKIQVKINQQRLKMLKPLADAEQQIRQRLNASYDQARAINNSVTSFLVSAAKVAENRNRYLDMLGVQDEELARVIDQVDSAVEGLTEKADKLASNEDKAREYYQKLTGALQKLKTAGGK